MDGGLPGSAADSRTAKAPVTPGSIAITRTKTPNPHRRLR